MEEQNWYEIPIIIPDEFRDWVSNNIPSDQVSSIPESHITLLYGFDPKFYNEIDQTVKMYNITSKDYTFGDPRKGDISPVWLLPIKSPKLEELFWILYSKFPNQHTLINGKYDPHVTLCWIKSPTKNQE